MMMFGLIQSLVLIAISWIAGEIIGVTLVRSLRSTGCKLSPEDNVLLEQLCGMRDVPRARFFVEEVPLGKCDSSWNVSLPSVGVTAEIPPVVGSLAELLFAYNAAVTLAAKHDLGYVHRPAYNVRSKSGEVLDEIEELLSLGRGEPSLLDVYYSQAPNVNIVPLPAEGDPVEFVEGEVRKQRSTEPLIFSKTLRSGPKKLRNFAHSGSWFRSKYRCSRLRNEIESDRNASRLTVALPLEERLAIPTLGLAANVELSAQTDMPPAGSGRLEKILEDRFSCNGCTVRLFTVPSSSVRHQTMAFKNLIESEVVVATDSDLSHISCAFSSGVKIVPSDISDIDGMLFHVPAVEGTVIQDVFREKFNRRFNNMFELKKLPEENMRFFV